MKVTEFLIDIGRPVAFYPGLRKITGSTVGTLFLCQFIYWTGKGADPDGWIYKTAADIESETGLSYDEQSTARKHLIRAGLIEEKYERLNHVMRFRIVPDAIESAWENRNSRKPDSGIRENGDPAVGNAENPGSLIGVHRLQSENTNIDSAAGAAGALSYDPDDFSDVTVEPVEPKTEKKSEAALLAESRQKADEARARVSAAIARGAEKFASQKIDLSGYPEDIRGILSSFVYRWKVEPPARVSADWIKGARAIRDASGEFGSNILPLYAERYERETEKLGRRPFMVSRPGSLVEPIRAFAAELRAAGTTELTDPRARRRGGSAPIEFGRVV